jgi:hypothetical protein
MLFFETFFLTKGGLFDFDITFFVEILEFIFLACIVTFVFLSPISKQLDERAEFINTTLRKSSILLSFGYEKLTTCIGFLILEMNELSRQLKLTKTYSNEKFENEVLFVQKESAKILSQLKGDLSVQSAYLFSSTTKELNTLTQTFFDKKFQS